MQATHIHIGYAVGTVAVYADHTGYNDHKDYTFHASLAGQVVKRVLLVTCHFSQGYRGSSRSHGSQGSHKKRITEIQYLQGSGRNQAAQFYSSMAPSPEAPGASFLYCRSLPRPTKASR